MSMLDPRTVAADLGVTLPAPPAAGRHAAAPQPHLDPAEARSVGVLRLINGFPPVERTALTTPGRHHRDDAPPTVHIVLVPQPARPWSC